MIQEFCRLTRFFRVYIKTMYARSRMRREFRYIRAGNNFFAQIAAAAESYEGI